MLVSSFMIRGLSLAKFSKCISLSLWGNEGPNWILQYNLWLDEQASEWTPVICKQS
jgi:hypothetical protein